MNPVIITQNVPQLALQIYFLIEIGDSSSSDLIVYGSMLFSIISIIANVLTHCTQKSIVKSTGRVSVLLDVTGNEVNRRENRTRYKSIRREFAAILEIDKSLIEMARAMPIKDGLRVNIDIYINHTRAIDMDIQGILRKNMENGEIATIFQNAWDLGKETVCSNLKVERIASKKRMEHTVIVSQNTQMKRFAPNPALETQSNISPLEQFPTPPFQEREFADPVLPLDEMEGTVGTVPFSFDDDDVHDIDLIEGASYLERNINEMTCK